MEKKESSAKTVNWEDEYNTWFCASDELLEDLMLNAHPTATGLLLTVENMTFKITRPDSTSLISCLAWVIEDKGSDQTAREIASMTHGQCMEMKFDSLAEVMSTLVKNVREYTGYGGFPAPTSQFSTDSAENRSKPIDNSFSDSKLFKAASEAGDYLKSSKLKYAAKIYIFKDLSMAKIEFNINCIEMTPVAVDNMGLTYDSTLSINFRYNPDLLAITNNPNLTLLDYFVLSYIKLETNQDGTKVSFASNYVLDLANRYLDILKRNKKIIEELTADRFLNVFFLEDAGEMGKSEAQVAPVLCKSGNDVQATIKDLGLTKHEYIEYYSEELSKKEVNMHNLLVNLTVFVKKHLERCTSFCVSCGRKLLDESVRLSPCNSDFCMFKFEEIFGVKLYPELQNNFPLVDLDLSLAAKAVYSTRALDIFEPFPTFFLKGREERSRSVFAKGTGIVAVNKENKDIETIRRILKSFPSPKSIKELSISEMEVTNMLKATYPVPEDMVAAYKLVTYVIATNRLSLNVLEKTERITAFPEDYTQFIVTNLNPEFERKFEISKKKYGSTFLFHGSSQENWYSILRNGLRVLSNTKYMTAGAAYGAGVYGSQNFGTSLSYSSRSWMPSSSGTKGWDNDPYPGCVVIGIMECILEGVKNKGDLNVVCIPKDEYVALRYLMVVPRSSSGGGAAAISTSLKLHEHYYDYVGKIKAANAGIAQHRMAKQIEKIEHEAMEKAKAEKILMEEEKTKQEEEDAVTKMSKLFIGKGSASANKRLLIEYRSLSTSKDFKNFALTFKEDNVYIWRMVFDILKFDLTKELKADFESLKDKHGMKKPELEFEVLFSQDFPYDPPFIRVVRPRFAFHTGHITVGGSICMEVLTKSGWTVAISLENLFVDIITTICLGGGRLDAKNCAVPYTMQEAKDAFARVARDHGWLKG